MKKIISAFIALMLVFSLASCTSKPNKTEQKYLDAAQEYLDNEEYISAQDTVKAGLKEEPDSEYLAAMLQTVNDAMPAVPTADEVKTRFTEFYNLVMKWYVTGNVSTSDEEMSAYNHTYENGNTEEVYPTLVAESGVSTKAELDKLFLGYCTEECYKQIEELGPPLGFYDDVDGRLVQSHFIGGWEGGYTFDDASVKAASSGSESFIVSALKMEEEEEFLTVYEISCTYSRDSSGKFRFGVIKENAVSEDCGEDEQYKATAGGTSLNLRAMPHDNAEAVLALTEGQVVTGITKYSGWVYVKTESGTRGWIKASLLTEYTAASSGRRSGGSGNNIVNDVVNAGVRIAGGVIGSIF